MQLNVNREPSGEARELRALFEKQLRELYWAEKTMLTSLAVIINNCFSKDLIAVLEAHSPQTTVHIMRLEHIFSAIGIPAGEEKYEALQCFIDEAKQFIRQTSQGVVRDAGIISLFQKMKHYEIASYGTMKAYAIALREEDIVVLFDQSLEEEKHIDTQLTKVAESHINIEAADKEI